MATRAMNAGPVTVDHKDTFQLTHKDRHARTAITNVAASHFPTSVWTVEIIFARSVSARMARLKSWIVTVDRCRCPLHRPRPEPDDLTVALRYVQLTMAVGAIAAIIAGLTA